MKKNGKGKEYYFNNELKYEGEYLNGKIWNGERYNKIGDSEFEIWVGKGKEYSLDGKLVFEGEYLNGERNWKGKEYDGDDILIYLKGNIKMEKVMEKVKNIIIIAI